MQNQASHPPPIPHDPSHSDDLSAFRHQIKQTRENDPLGWESTRKLVGHCRLQETCSRLADQIILQTGNSPLGQRLLQALGLPNSVGSSSVQSEALKELTGFPPSKAIRALCLYYQVGVGSPTPAPGPSISQLNDLLNRTSNPYDLLLDVEHPSLLDMGAGDLTFEEELIEQYVPKLRGRQHLIVHAIDRLQPGSQLGGVYHANQERLRKFSGMPSETLQFRFWGGLDMAESLTLRGLLPRYTIVTCHAPATPTFAYEPQRVNPKLIQTHLAQTKGTFRTIRVDGEEALEVHHRGKALTFPAWKFAVQGPLVLLELLARRGSLCVLSAIDTDVFWEILSQLIESPTVRPSNIMFTPENIPDIFGPVHAKLSALKEEDRVRLETLTPIRTRLDFRLPMRPHGFSGFCFQSVEIRRGAVFPGIPASFTARQFVHMREETPPWSITLIPELITTPS